MRNEVVPAAYSPSWSIAANRKQCMWKIKSLVFQQKKLSVNRIGEFLVN